MKLMMESKTLLYMVTLSYEDSIEDRVEYFESLNNYPDLVQRAKLLFTWSPKIIMEESDPDIQQLLMGAKFIPSIRYPGYYMNLLNSEICDCDWCKVFAEDAISNKYTSPTRSCTLPIKSSPLDVVKEPRIYRGKLWERMFRFAWKAMQISDSDSESSSCTESSESE